LRLYHKRSPVRSDSLVESVAVWFGINLLFQFI
jgi:hypothetical protein